MGLHVVDVAGRLRDRRGITWKLSAGQAPQSRGLELGDQVYASGVLVFVQTADVEPLPS